MSIWWYAVQITQSTLNMQGRVEIECPSVWQRRRRNHHLFMQRDEVSTLTGHSRADFIVYNSIEQVNV